MMEIEYSLHYDAKTRQKMYEQAKEIDTLGLVYEIL